MHIAFVHPHKAFLPEIPAYSAYFSQKGWKTSTWQPTDKLPDDVTVEWRMMGTHYGQKHPKRILIHEYASPSTPPFAALKNTLKGYLNTNPELRIFQNEYVQRSFTFKKQTPFVFRDMGIPESWLTESQALPPQHDFIYVGSVEKNRSIPLLLDRFTTTLKAHTLLIVSRNYEALREKYRHATNIRFTGPLSPETVQELILQASFAINFIPPVAPFNQLTSTKFLEYAACNSRIITTNYPWLENFQQQYGGNYFHLTPDLGNLTWEEVNTFKYACPADMRPFTWEQRIKQSGIETFLEQF